MAIELIDDSTMDTVLRCSDCGEEFRYNFDGEHSDDCEDDSGECGCYDAFVDWAIEDAESKHECARDDDDDDDTPQEDDITTTDDRRFYSGGRLVLQRAYSANGSVETDEWYYRADATSSMRFLGRYSDRDDALRAYMDRVQFWPNCWSISDHGNAHLITFDRK